MSYIVKPNQSLIDIAIEVFGSLEKLPELALANGISITDELSVGQVLIIEPSKNPTTDFLTKESITIATDEPLVLGSMIIGSTLII